MRVLGVQLDIRWEDKPANFARVTDLLEKEDPPEGSLVVLPEMFATGFSMRVDLVADGDERETDRFLSELASRRGLHVMGGYVERAADGRGSNRAVLFGPDGREVVRYSKIHPFTFGGEPRHYAPGNRIEVADCGEFRLAPFICYDLRFPEVFRIAVRRGVSLFVLIANWPTPRVDHWVALVIARAIENQAYVVAVNRVGHDPRLHYPGRSLIVDPRGRVLADGGDAEGIVSYDLDLDLLLRYRDDFPTLPDLRPDFVPETPERAAPREERDRKD